ncbi:antitoxin VbhA family protein [Burkholderia pseudomallei]|uniref:antitoxin VbhA family protein n=1 Tax=Burkholderia pseudomallei TaxID=28450 RepID=UPI001AAF01C1|nr:antitoxin VbhA family protein [Burkholderia pseudomallei]MBO2977503.1 antitoxin VbhA family protein [Burkholderia pseudomallei]MBO3047290.1 antitoxin VbhA family protein [Burkholderia pseudomallei]
MAEKLNSVERQRELRELFRRADAISRLEGYEPGDFEEAQKERLITGEIATEEFISIVAAHVREGALGKTG